MNEISSIDQLIENIPTIDSEIRLYELQIKNQDKYHDWEKPNMAELQKKLKILIDQRKIESNIIIENAKARIQELSNKFGISYFVCYSNYDENKYIGIHREKCEYFKKMTDESKVKFKSCKSYTEGLTIGFKLIKNIQTDISTDCQDCVPYWNLNAIEKSLY